MAKKQITPLRVGAYFEDETAGQRVDEMMSALSRDLQNLKAADTEAVAGQDPATIGSSGIFFQTFESPITTWTKRSNLGAVTYPTNGQAGGLAFSSAGGETFYEFPGNIPFADDRLYRIRAKFRMTVAPSVSTKDLVSVGVQGVGADGTTIVDTSGTADPDLAHWYAAASVDMGALSLNTWYTYTGYFQGWGAASTTPSTDADAARLMSANVRYIRPCFKLNHDGGDGTMEIDYISLEVLTEASEGNELLKDVVNLTSGKVATNKVVEGSITAGSISTNKLDAQAVTAAKIETGTITATQITGSTLSAIYADVGTLTGGIIRNGGSDVIIDLDASGTAKFIDAANFWLKANGDAEFGGTVAGNSFTGTNAVFSGSIKTYGGGGSFSSLLNGSVHAVNLISGDDISIDISGSSAGRLRCNSTTILDMDASKLAFFGTTAISKPTVTGSRAGNAALASALTALANLGLITDSST